MAPATKYGGKIVECQPGTIATEKSKLTTLCTESTSGVASPASSKYAIWCRCQCAAELRQPNAKKAYTFFCQSFFARSRTVARSGTRPRYQNNNEMVK